MRLSTRAFAFISILFIILSAGCRDPNALSPLAEENFDISVDLLESNSVGGYIIIANNGYYHWSKTHLELTIIELATGNAYPYNINLGTLPAYTNRGVFIESTRQITGDRCYSYELTVTIRDNISTFTDTGGSCSE